MIFGPIVVLVLRPSGPTNVSDTLCGSSTSTMSCFGCVCSWWEMCFCSWVRRYNAVAGRCLRSLAWNAVAYSALQPAGRNSRRTLCISLFLVFPRFGVCGRLRTRLPCWRNRALPGLEITASHRSWPAQFCKWPDKNIFRTKVVRSFSQLRLFFSFDTLLKTNHTESILTRQLSTIEAFHRL